MMLTSCQNLQTKTTETVNKSIPCQALKPISYSSKNDTQITKDQIKELNSIYYSLCEK